MSTTAIANTNAAVIAGRLTIDRQLALDALQRHLDVLHAAHRPSADHCRRVGALTHRLARFMGLDETHVQTCTHSALLHDIGKAAVDTTLLDAARPLTTVEKRHIDRHAGFGAAMLKGDPTLRHLAHAVSAHHDRFDTHGRGIPLAARLIAVTDAWDAMTQPRPYAGPMPPRAAADELARCADTQFDGTIIDAFLAMIEAPRLRLTA